MYAVIESGGKQYRVELGSEIQVDRMDVAPGDSITLDRVLLIADADDTAIGRPIVDGATVSAQVLGQDRGVKIVVFKYKPKARRRVKKGFRAELTTLRISDISFGGRSAAQEERTAAERTSKAAQASERAAAAQAAADRELAARLAADNEASAARTDETVPQSATDADADDAAIASTRKPKSRAKAATAAKASAPTEKDPTSSKAKSRTRSAAEPEPAAEPARAAEPEPAAEAAAPESGTDDDSSDDAQNEGTKKDD